VPFGFMGFYRSKMVSASNPARYQIIRPSFSVLKGDWVAKARVAREGCIRLRNEETPGTSRLLGLVGLTQMAPMMLFTLPAGHVADNHDRKRIIVLMTLRRTFCTLARRAWVCFRRRSRPVRYCVRWSWHTGRLSRRRGQRCSGLWPGSGWPPSGLDSRVGSGSRP